MIPKKEGIEYKQNGVRLDSKSILYLMHGKEVGLQGE
jgi:hypothetical protein